MSTEIFNKTIQDHAIKFQLMRIKNKICKFNNNNFLNNKKQTKFINQAYMNINNHNKWNK